MDDAEEVNRSNAYVSFFLAVLAVVMFFFRRNFVKKMTERKNQDS